MGGDEYEKIKYVFETIVDQTDYDLSAPDNQNIYSVFGNWTSVCAGYAKASKYLLDQLGVECIYVTGDASGEAHAWNIVRCDGQYYCYDATWGDPLYQEGIGVEMDTTSYEYLCCPDSMLSRRIRRIRHIPFRNAQTFRLSITGWRAGIWSLRTGRRYSGSCGQISMPARSGQTSSSHRPIYTMK